MEDSESVSSMNSRFINIHRRSIEEEMVKKILRRLTRSWEIKKIAIKEAQDLSSLKYEELIGPLIIYEISLQYHKEKRTPKSKRKGYNRSLWRILRRGL